MRLVIYARVSTKDQSCDLQLRDLRSYSNARGFSLLREYVDVGESGAQDSRPQLDELMAAARKRYFDAVMVWRFDRFARSTKHLLLALEEFRSLGIIQFISYPENIDISSHTTKSVPAGRSGICRTRNTFISADTTVLAGACHKRQHTRSSAGAHFVYKAMTEFLQELGLTIIQFRRQGSVLKSRRDKLHPATPDGPLLAVTSGMPSARKMTRYSSLSLTEIVCLCADEGGDEAWQEFVSRVGRPISLTIMRTASRWGQPSRSLVEDLVQATYLKLWEGGCRLLRDFAIQRPDAILGYLKKTAANATHDYFKHGRSQSSGGGEPHVSTSDVDPQAGDQAQGSEQRIAFEIFLSQIDEYLKRCPAAPDQERDRMIFWLYFRQGMSAKEIASLPMIGLGAKGIGSVIERLKHGIREHILGMPSGCDDGAGVESKANFVANSF